jgi:luciferase family oxidoreductase group 1
MSYRLSILDKVLVPEGVSAAEAFAHALTLAVRADELGYHRYWFAEHHGAAAIASSAPEVAAAFVLARTKHIRVGSGGVMLQHYAPLKVAELFNVLSALAPGRVDIGIGRAPGGFPASTRALRRAGGEGPGVSFEAKFAELDGYLTDGSVEPAAPEGVDRILLGASVESAELAARRGWLFCYAGHFDGDPQRMAEALEAYRRSAKRAPMLAVVALASETPGRALEYVRALKLFRVRFSTGEKVNLSTEEAVVDYASQIGATDYLVEEIQPSVLAGPAAEIRAELDRLSREFGIEEFIIDMPIANFAIRRASLEALGGLSP